jgi:S-methylmethionine-dependent homocysteine/selenocysteine methylase
MIGAITMTNPPEAIGIVHTAIELGMPVYISFTVETDGRLPTGDKLEAAIGAVDGATGSYPAYYLVNCAHPDHFAHVLLGGDEWVRRIRGLRANASRCSHAELDAMTDLDDGNPAELGQLYRSIRKELPWLNILGGCCGTDLRHITAIAQACGLREPALPEGS